MRIFSMHVENFMSFGAADFDFDAAGLVLVVGENHDDASASSNGSGKSAMIDALVWCLFGKTLRGAEHDEVVNRKVGQGCVVTVDFGEEADEHVGARLHRVGRARKHPKHKNSLWAMTNDDDVSGPSAAETQAVVERLLGCTHRTFLSSVVFGQDRSYRFSALTDAEQKKVLDEVIGVERFAQACAEARRQHVAVSDELEVVRLSLTRAEEARAEAEAEAVDLQAKDVDFSETQRTRLEVETEKLDKAREWVKKNEKLAGAGVDSLKVVADKLLRELASREKAVDQAADHAAGRRAARDAAESSVAGAEADLKRRQKLASDCPTCGQKVDPKKSSRVLDELRSRLELLKSEHVDAVATARDADAALAERKQKLKVTRDAMLDVQRALNESVGAQANVSAWRKRAADHEARIAELEEGVNPYAALAEKARARHARHDKEANDLHAQEVILEERAKLAEFWVRAFGAKGLRSLLIDSSLPLLNEEAARVSRAVTGGAISVEFSATSEQKSGKVVDRFEVRVDNKHGAGDYAGNSAGERAKVDLCVGLALQRLVASRSTAASFNVAFYDEVFDHLDSAAHERVVGVLSELDKDSIFVVSHDEGLKAWFPATLTIAKRGGLSTIEV